MLMDLVSIFHGTFSITRAIQTSSGQHFLKIDKKCSFFKKIKDIYNFKSKFVIDFQNMVPYK